MTRQSPQICLPSRRTIYTTSTPSARMFHKAVKPSALDHSNLRVSNFATLFWRKTGNTQGRKRNN